MNHEGDSGIRNSEASAGLPSGSVGEIPRPAFTVAEAAKLIREKKERLQNAGFSPKEIATLQEAEKQGVVREVLIVLAALQVLGDNGSFLVRVKDDNKGKAWRAFAQDSGSDLVAILRMYSDYLLQDPSNIQSWSNEHFLYLPKLKELKTRAEDYSRKYIQAVPETTFPEDTAELAQPAQEALTKSILAGFPEKLYVKVDTNYSGPVFKRLNTKPQSDQEPAAFVGRESAGSGYPDHEYLLVLTSFGVPKKKQIVLTTVAPVQEAWIKEVRPDLVDTKLVENTILKFDINLQGIVSSATRTFDNGRIELTPQQVLVSADDDSSASQKFADVLVESSYVSHDQVKKNREAFNKKIETLKKTDFSYSLSDAKDAFKNWYAQKINNATQVSQLPQDLELTTADLASFFGVDEARFVTLLKDAERNAPDTIVIGDRTIRIDYLFGTSTQKEATIDLPLDLLSSLENFEAPPLRGFQARISVEMDNPTMVNEHVFAEIVEGKVAQALTELKEKYEQRHLANAFELFTRQQDKTGGEYLPIPDEDDPSELVVTSSAQVFDRKYFKNRISFPTLAVGPMVYDEKTQSVAYPYYKYVSTRPGEGFWKVAWARSEDELKDESAKEREKRFFQFKNYLSQKDETKNYLKELATRLIEEADELLSKIHLKRVDYRVLNTLPHFGFDADYLKGQEPTSLLSYIQNRIGHYDYPDLETAYAENDRGEKYEWRRGSVPAPSSRSRSASPPQIKIRLVDEVHQLRRLKNYFESVVQQLEQDSSLAEFKPSESNPSESSNSAVSSDQPVGARPEITGDTSFAAPQTSSSASGPESPQEISAEIEAFFDTVTVTRETIPWIAKWLLKYKMSDLNESEYHKLIIDFSNGTLNSFTTHVPIRQLKKVFVHCALTPQEMDEIKAYLQQT